MKIEHLETGSPDCPLVRIYGTSAQEFETLHSIARKLADSILDRVAVADLPGYGSIDGISLSFAKGAKSEGFVQNGKQFELRITDKDWERIADLIEPFVQRTDGYQWLWNAVGDPVTLLLSATERGNW